MALPSLAPASTPFAQLLSVIVAKVWSSLGLEPCFNHVVANDEYKVTETENLFIYIRPYGPTPVDGSGRPFGDYGAGRLSRLIARRIRFYIYTRSGVDSYGDDTIALQGNDPLQTVITPPVLPGQFIAEELVLNTLDDWTPLDVSDTYALSIGPIHWVDSADGPPVRAPENEEGLVRSHLDFEVVYVSSIIPTEPAP